MALATVSEETMNGKYLTFRPAARKRNRLPRPSQRAASSSSQISTPGSEPSSSW